jgi:hypothetical protein
MKEILEQNSEVIQQAGQALVDIGSELAAGRIDDAFKRMDAAHQKYTSWKELDQAILDIDEAVSNQKNTLAVQQILTELVVAVLGSAIRKGI